MIQISAVDVETNRREATAYLSLVKREGELLGYRLIWVEKGEQRHSKVTFLSPHTPFLEIVARCYANPEIKEGEL